MLCQLLLQLLNRSSLLFIPFRALLTAKLTSLGPGNPRRADSEEDLASDDCQTDDDLDAGYEEELREEYAVTFDLPGKSVVSYTGLKCKQERIYQNTVKLLLSDHQKCDEFVVAYGNRPTGGLLREEVPGHLIFCPKKFIACS